MRTSLSALLLSSASLAGCAHRPAGPCFAPRVGWVTYGVPELLAPRANGRPDRAGLIGAVVDSATGRGVPLVPVVLVPRAGGTRLEAQTDSLGRFAFGDVLPDAYEVQVHLIAQYPDPRPVVQLAAGQTDTLRVRLPRADSIADVCMTIMTQ